MKAQKSKIERPFEIKQDLKKVKIKSNKIGKLDFALLSIIKNINKTNHYEHPLKKSTYIKMLGILRRMYESSIGF
jgi:hypothetical protein